MLEIRKKRKKRVRSKIFGTSTKPRFSVFRSSKYIYAQLIDDAHRKTIVSAKSMDLKDQKIDKVNDLKAKTLIAYNTGLLIAKKASEKNIKEVIFDRGEYLYHGRVKALAEGARSGGLKF